jgi:hypothetical protein
MFCFIKGKDRIYAACGVSQTPNNQSKTKGVNAADRWRGKA